ncbi:MAG: LacI family DNA-binding transcriptional regulator [Solobacterium sp.]|nr:LacI family DNA-binding transcriptional regulator [Solobacterium sp.]
MVSMKEIAQKCGVSVATVSKALNDKDDIAESTKEMIRKVADEMGFMANASARALKTNRTYNIGVLFTNDDAGLAHDYFSIILNSFKVAAEEEGYDITFVNHKIAGRESTYLKHCEYRNFDGVAIILADFKDPEIIELAESKLPAVCIDYEYYNCSSVVSDNTKGLLDIVRYAGSMGHRKIAYIHGELTDVTKNRLMGFYDGCREQGITVDPSYVLQSNYHDIEQCSECTRKLLQLEDRPTCIICPDDYSAMGCLRVLAQEGLSVPEDMSVIGYDGINMAMINGMTTYMQDSIGLGRIAFRKLADKIDHPEIPAEHSVVFGKFIVGRTVAKIGD